MRVAASIVTSDKSEIIGSALESIKGKVDGIVVVDLGTDEATRVLIEATCEDVCYLIDAQNLELTIGEMRNAGLTRASQNGYDAAIQLDTDERLSINVDFRKVMEEHPLVDVWNSLHVNGTYSRERIFRLPTKGKFVGQVHEEWRGGVTSLMPGFLFDELPKSEEKINHNLPIMIDGLAKQILQEPNNHRWYYQLALCYRAMNRPGKAIEVLEDALGYETIPEATAWDRYVKALCYMDMNMIERALTSCVDGLEYHPGLAELSHLAGVCCMKLGRPQEALCWANMAISNGLLFASSFAQGRLGPREPYALYEGPFELQRDAMKALGYPKDDMENAEQNVQHAIRIRRGKSNV